MFIAYLGLSDSIESITWSKLSLVCLENDTATALGSLTTFMNPLVILELVKGLLFISPQKLCVFINTYSLLFETIWFCAFIQYLEMFPGVAKISFESAIFEKNLLDSNLIIL